MYALHVCYNGRMNNSCTRRALLSSAAVASAAALLPAAEALRLGALPVAAQASTPPASFTFVHITDPHIQPELGAARGVAKCFDAIRALPHKPAFALVGGDLVMDAGKVGHARAEEVYALWRRAGEQLGLPLFYSVGNHDLYGLDQGGKSLPADPDFGKAIWKRHVGAASTYSAFEHGGWHFITLDSVGVTPDGQWQGLVDPAQLTWLDHTLRSLPAAKPIVVLTHMPLFTLYPVIKNGPLAAPAPYLVVTNSDAVRETFAGRAVKAVLQGHTHIVEDLEYRGTRYISGGAVCGNWWKGPQLGVHPEGFGLVTVRGMDLDYRYVPYGWHAVSA